MCWIRNCLLLMLLIGVLVSTSGNAGEVLFYNDFSEDVVGQAPAMGDPPYPPEGDNFLYNSVTYGKDAEISVATPIRAGDHAMLLWNKSSSNGQSFNVSGTMKLDQGQPYRKGFFRASWVQWMGEYPQYGRGPYFYLLTGDDNTTDPLLAVYITDGPDAYYYVRTKNAQGQPDWVKGERFFAGVAARFTVDLDLLSGRFSFYMNGLPLSGLQATPTANLGETSFLKWRFTTGERGNYRYALDDLSVSSITPSSGSPKAESGGAVSQSGKVNTLQALSPIQGGGDPNRAVMEIPLDVTASPSLAQLTFSLSPAVGKPTMALSTAALELWHFVVEPDGALTAGDFDAEGSLTESLGVVVEDISSLVGSTTLSVDVTEAVAADFAQGFAFSGFQLRLTDESQPEDSLLVGTADSGEYAPLLAIVASPPQANAFDLTGDDHSRHEDLYLLMHSVRSGQSATGDFNDDGAVDHEDVIQFSDHWME